jgi:hypothetical protein
MKVKTQVKAGLLDGISVSVIGQAAGGPFGTASNSGQTGVINVGPVSS